MQPSCFRRFPPPPNALARVNPLSNHHRPRPNTPLITLPLYVSRGGTFAHFLRTFVYAHHAVLVYCHAVLLQQVIHVRAQPLLPPLSEKKRRTSSGLEVSLDSFELLWRVWARARVKQEQPTKMRERGVRPQPRLSSADAPHFVFTVYLGSAAHIHSQGAYAVGGRLESPSF